MKIDAFLKLYAASAALSGETADNLFNRNIELTDFKIGGGQAADATALDAGDGKRSKRYCPFAFTISKEVDAASPYLFKAYCTTFSRRFLAEHNLYTKAEVSIRKAGGPSAAGSGGGMEYFKVVFGNAIVMTYTLTVPGDGKASETIGFAFQSVRVEYQQQTPVGGAAPPRVTKGWDYTLNKPPAAAR